MIQPAPFLKPLSVREPDAIHWHPDFLDREPEPLHCLHHGHELPCGQCEHGVLAAKGEELTS